MKKLIRKIVNWAYGINIHGSLALNAQHIENLAMIVNDTLINYKAIGFQIPEDSPLGKFIKEQGEKE